MKQSYTLQFTRLRAASEAEFTKRDSYGIEFWFLGLLKLSELRAKDTFRLPEAELEKAEKLSWKRPTRILRLCGICSKAERSIRNICGPGSAMPSITGQKAIRITLMSTYPVPWKRPGNGEMTLSWQEICCRSSWRILQIRCTGSWRDETGLKIKTVSGSV